MNVEQQLRLMVNSPALLEAVAILLPLARKEAEALAGVATNAKGFSTSREDADKWTAAVLLTEAAFAACAPQTLAQVYRP